MSEFRWFVVQVGLLYVVVLLVVHWWVLRILFLPWPPLPSLVASLLIFFYLYGWVGVKERERERCFCEGEFKVVLLIQVHIPIFF